MSSLKKQLTKEEALFCEIYVNGTAEYVADSGKCYSLAFGEPDEVQSKLKGRLLLSEERIGAYIAELSKLAAEESRSMKQYLTENLKSIIRETSTAQFYDQKGTELSTAPLRSVAVSAMKLLADLYPVKEAQASKLSIEGGDGASITFNVIVPESKTENDPAE